MGILVCVRGERSRVAPVLFGKPIAVHQPSWRMEGRVMTEEFDAPLGQPNPPPTERASPPIGWILSLMLVVGLVVFVAHYLGFL